MLRIAVCIKPVPDPGAAGTLHMTAENTLCRDNVPHVINPLDKYALETALIIKGAHEACVSVYAMSASENLLVLRGALALGADEAILLSDKAFAGSDSLATAKILAAGIQANGGADLVLLGYRTSDSGTAQVPCQVAELLGFPYITGIDSLVFHSANEVLISRRQQAQYVTFKGTLPILLSVNKGANQPRQAKMAGILAAGKQTITVLGKQDIEVDEREIGMAGSYNKTGGTVRKDFRRQCVPLTGEVDEIASTVWQIANNVAGQS